MDKKKETGTVDDLGRVEGGRVWNWLVGTGQDWEERRGMTEGGGRREEGHCTSPDS